MVKTHSAAGFTLPELLIVLTVLAVLMAAGLPSFGEFVRNQRLKTASFDLFSTLVMSRSEARLSFFSRIHCGRRCVIGRVALYKQTKMPPEGGTCACSKSADGQ